MPATLRITPTPPVGPGLGLRFRAISAGQGHACGIIMSGAAYCWGDNFLGQLGDGTSQSLHVLPVAVAPALGLRLATIIASGAHTCGLTIDGAGYCWGYHESGGLGDGTTMNRSSPVVVSYP
jgi:alpha-tubulin suppressor-like RCC1 family protein